MSFLLRFRNATKASRAHTNHITMKSYTGRTVSPVSFQQCGFLGEGETHDAQTASEPACVLWSDTPVLCPTSRLQEGFSSSYLHGQADTLSALLNSNVSVRDRDIAWSNLASLTWRQEPLKEGLLASAQPAFQNAINLLKLRFFFY